MNHSESLAQLAPALVAAQAEIGHAHKNAKNPHFKSTFADLVEVLDTIRPVYAKHGLAVVQVPGWADGAVTLSTMILHTSGEFIGGISGAPVVKNDPQGVGSAITYLRRYSLTAMAGIGQTDDDGEAASEHNAQQEPDRAAPKPPTKAQLAALDRIMSETIFSDAERDAVNDKLHKNNTFDYAAKLTSQLLQTQADRRAALKEKVEEA